MVRKSLILTMVFLLVASIGLVGCNSSTKTGSENSSTATNDNSSNNNDSSAKADDYPNKPITIVITYAPGKAGDTFSRTFGKILEKYIGQTVVPVNKEGGSGAIGVNHMLAQPADGYTIAYQSSTFAYTIAAKQVPFTSNDVTAISVINADYQALSVPKDSPFKTLDDFIKYAKENPGKLKIAGSGTKGTNHVFVLKMLKDAGIDATYVPYDGGSKALAAVLGKNVDAIASSSSVVNQSVDAGDLRMLAVTSAERVESRSDIPTFKELGLTSIDDEFIWRGFFAKPGIPQERLDKLNKAFSQVVKDPDWLDYMEKNHQMEFYKDSSKAPTFFENYIKSSEELFKTLQ